MKIIDTYDIEKMARAAHQSGIHLADSREDWLKLMMSMAGGGERLLDSFLLLASMAGSKYHEKESRREFIKAVPKSSDIGLIYFINQCEANGLSRNDFRIQRYQPSPMSGQNRSARYKLSAHHSHLNTQNPQNSNNMTPTSQPSQPILTLDSKWIEAFSYNSNKAKSSEPNSFLSSVVKAKILSKEEAKQAADLFHIGTTKKGEVIYWQIDAQGQLRDGKIMMYDEHCHRCKDSVHHVDWVNHKLRFQKILPMNWKPVHCLFGLHQIAGETPDNKPSTVCIVEAEKTAFICSQKFKKYAWMASGGMNALTVEVLKDLAGHRVILYPDTDKDGEAYRTWYKIAWEAKTVLGLDIKVSDFLEKNATPEQKERKIDLADWIIENKDDEDGEEGEESEESAEGEESEESEECSQGSECSKGEESAEVFEGSKGKVINGAKCAGGMVDAQMSEQLKEMIRDNPDVAELIKTFGLIEVRGGPL